MFFVLGLRVDVVYYLLMIKMTQQLLLTSSIKYLEIILQTTWFDSRKRAKMLFQLQLTVFLLLTSNATSYQENNLQKPLTSSSLSLVSNDYPTFTQVISDVDDTLKSSGGVNVGGVALGGIDVQYERGDFYPGVAEFMLEISRHGLSDEDSKSPPKVAVLTARAEELKLALEIKENSKLAVAMRAAGDRAGIPNWGIGPVLYGSVAEWIIQYRKG